MTVVSIRDFRANQSKYLGLAAGGESVILTSRTGSFKIVPITEDDSLISKKEFFARIDEARKSIAEGKGTSVSGKEELDSLLASLECTHSFLHLRRAPLRSQSVPMVQAHLPEA